MRLPALAALLIVSLAGSGCGYHSLMQQDEQVRAAWSEVASVLQQRTDLVPNLLGAAQVLATRETRALQAVREAQAKAVSIQLTPEVSRDPAALAQLEAAEADLSRALGALIVIAQRYREVESDPAFREFSAELATTQERVTRALAQYVDSVKRYNGAVESFPSSLTARLLEMSARPTFPDAPPAAVPAVTPDASLPSTPFAAARPAATPSPGT